MPEPINGFDVSIKGVKAAKVGLAGIDIAFYRFGQSDDARVAGVMPPGVSR